MNLKEAAQTLNVWDLVKVHAEIWSTSNTYPTLDTVQLEIKSKFKQLATTKHPDVGGDTSEFIRINTAYRMLSKASGAEFISALSIKDVYTPGDSICMQCRKWNSMCNICITTDCSGFDAKK